MNNPSEFRHLIEKVKAETEVYQIKLPVADTALSPVLSKKAVDLHYGILYKNYVKKALAGEGDFQIAGAKLHTLFFEQFQAPSASNNPSGAINLLINDKFGSYEKFKDAFSEIALNLHGSGWVYMNANGTIKTIPIHKIPNDTVSVIIDMWEHSYIIDYGANKEKYLKDIWKIINWSTINVRLN